MDTNTLAIIISLAAIGITILGNILRGIGG